MGCGSGDRSAEGVDSTARQMPDTLRVATLYSPMSYFIYRDQPMGYDYTLISDYAQATGRTLDLQVAKSLDGALALLDSGLVDIVAYEVPVTAHYKASVAHCGPVSVTRQVLVQPRGDSLITDVTQLIGRDVYVEQNSKYQRRMANLNDELGGGIRIHPVDRDTLITEDLLEMVSNHQIPLTVVDSDIARINKTYYPDLDISLPLSFEQRAQWAVAKPNAWMADSINAWFEGDLPRRHVNEAYKRYFELSKAVPTVLTYDLKGGRISPYDHLFKKYAPQLGWDWRLLASLGFVESRFDNNVTSWAGARGIMQVMPSTARAQGVDPAALADPETSIRVAVKILQSLDRTFARYVPDAEARRPFVLAAYNAGGAHIIDAIAIAGKTGHNPQIWAANVEQALLLKAQPEHYNDPAVRFGYFRGRQTVAHVDQVMTFYHRARQAVKS